MPDGDYYASYADVQHILMNANLGVAGGNILDDNGIEKILKSTQGKLHMKLRQTTLTCLTNAVHVEILKEHQIALLTQGAIRARHMKETNLADTDVLSTYWTLGLNLTREMKEDLEFIRQDVSGVAYNYNTRTGYEIV